MILIYPVYSQQGGRIPFGISRIAFIAWAGCPGWGKYEECIPLAVGWAPYGGKVRLVQGYIAEISNGVNSVSPKVWEHSKVAYLQHLTYIQPQNSLCPAHLFGPIGCGIGYVRGDRIDETHDIDSMQVIGDGRDTAWTHQTHKMHEIDKGAVAILRTTATSASTMSSGRAVTMAISSFTRTKGTFTCRGLVHNALYIIATANIEPDMIGPPLRPAMSANSNRPNIITTFPYLS